MLASGIAFVLVDWLHPGGIESEVDPIFVSIMALPMGVVFTAWSIRLWQLRRLANIAEEEFHKFNSLGF